MSELNVFVSTLLAIYTVVYSLESYVDCQGINITNWIDQIFGNSGINYPLSMVIKRKDSKPVKLSVDSGFMPVDVKRNSGDYLKNLKSANVENPQNETYLLLGYFLTTLILGKNPSVINSGRGLIVERMLKELTLESFDLTIKGYSSGGKDKPHDVSYNLDELNALVKFFSVRSKRITTLGKRNSVVSDKPAVYKRSNVKVEIID